MKSFEEILREGKDKVKPAYSKPKKWREQINLLMETLHCLNEMYGTTKEHQLKIKTHNCKKCGLASFIIAIRDIEKRDSIVKFHRGGWTAIDKDTYYCSGCTKKGKK